MVRNFNFNIDFDLDEPRIESNQQQMLLSKPTHHQVNNINAILTVFDVISHNQYCFYQNSIKRTPAYAGAYKGCGGGGGGV